ncbi:succinate receptor 1-like [Polyodon spathula]|uniref:succinate receptor 1-like n=1 Tax=Polyodon spathula TaxID=7913 RepID=UPI001B7DEADA|nr:succinate receptor 1-like [Polyodon spathula]
MANNTASDCTGTAIILENYYLPTMYSIEFILGLVGNVIVICGYIFCLKDWKSGNIYLFNLALSDLIFLCTLPRLAVAYARNSNMVSIRFFCLSNRYILHLNLYSSILFLTWISIDRYLLLKFPMRQHLLQRRSAAICICILIWVLVTLQIVPILTFINANKNDTCYDYASSGDPFKSLIYSLSLTVTGYLIPLTVLSIFYVKIATFLKIKDRQFQRDMLFQRPRALVFLAVGIFLFLLTPYHIMRNVRIALRMRTGYTKCTETLINSLYIITRPIAFLHSVINPVFYFLLGDHFREALLKKIRAVFERSSGD